MKTLITPLGFHTDHVLSFLMAEGFSKRDRIVVLRPLEREDEDRGEKAFGDVENLVNSVASAADLKKIVLDVQDIEEVVRGIAKVFEDNKENEIIVNLSGGVRRIIVGLTLCCTIYGDRIKKAYSYCPIARDIQGIELPYLRSELRDNELNILRSAVRDGPVSYTELANATHLSKSSVSRISKELESRGLLELKTKGREMLVESSLAGELVCGSVG